MATRCGCLPSAVSDLFGWPLFRDDIAANRLTPVLEEFNPGDIDELHAVYLGQGGLLPIRIRVFLEFLAQHIKIGEGRPSRDI